MPGDRRLVTFRITGAKRSFRHDRHESGAVPYHLRTSEELAGFFDGLELIEPGLVPVTRWRPEAELFGLPEAVDALGGVGREP